MTQESAVNQTWKVLNSSMQIAREGEGRGRRECVRRLAVAHPPKAKLLHSTRSEPWS